MKLTRRGLFNLVLSAPLAALIPVKSKPKFNYGYFHLDGTPFNNGKTPISLYGVPYHQSNISTGQWLGFNREVK